VRLRPKVSGYGGYILITGQDGIRYALRPNRVAVVHDADECQEDAENSDVTNPIPHRYTAWLREDGWPEDKIASEVEKLMCELYRSLRYEYVNFDEITRDVSRTY
jgi:hypothetical protein